MLQTYSFMQQQHLKLECLCCHYTIGDRVKQNTCHVAKLLSSAQRLYNEVAASARNCLKKARFRQNIYCN